MCRIIVRWLDKPDNPGQAPNRKQFDPVSVIENGVDPGSRVGYPTYMIFDLPDCSVAGAFFLLEPQYDPDGPLDPDTGKGKNFLKRAGFAMAWHRLSTPIQNAIIAAYEADVPYPVPGVTDEDLVNWFDKKV